MQKVFVLDKRKQPLSPCHPARARELLEQGKAAVYRRYPFTIILKERTGGVSQPLQIKFDPGSKTTGIALVQENQSGNVVVWGAELTHKGQAIVETLAGRLSLRRGRRSRHSRYRPSRQLNRANARIEGRLMPSIRSRVNNVIVSFSRLYKLAPVSMIGYELVKFDTQLMQNAEISGVLYQQGELLGYEVREYILEKWDRKCAYCGKKDCPLQIEHIQPRSRGGSDRVGNLTLACEGCNKAKGNLSIKEFLIDKPDILRRILAHAKAPLKDAAAVNITRWAIFNQLKNTGLPLETGTGARTKFNRTKQGYDKAHWIDAACVGVSGERVFIPATIKPALIRAMGRGSRQATRVNKFGFPCASAKDRGKRRNGYQTGDIVQLEKRNGKYRGVHVGRVTTTSKTGGEISSINRPDCKRVSISRLDAINVVQRSDGYGYS